VAGSFFGREDVKIHPHHSDSHRPPAAITRQYHGPELDFGPRHEVETLSNPTWHTSILINQRPSVTQANDEVINLQVTLNPAL
jgi:hypothetical protein